MTEHDKKLIQEKHQVLLSEINKREYFINVNTEVYRVFIRNIYSYPYRNDIFCQAVIINDFFHKGSSETYYTSLKNIHGGDYTLTEFYTTREECKASAANVEAILRKYQTSEIVVGVY